MKSSEVVYSVFGTVGTIIAGAVAVGLCIGPGIQDRAVATAATASLNRTATQPDLRSIEFYSEQHLIGPDQTELRCRGELAPAASGMPTTFNERVYDTTDQYPPLRLQAARKSSGQWVVLTNSTKKEDISAEGVQLAVELCTAAVEKTVSQYHSTAAEAVRLKAGNAASYARTQVQ